MAEHLASIFGTEKDRVNCPFYFKIGACRHGDRCSRLHNRPTISPTLLLSNMYQRPDMITPGVDAQGQPISPHALQSHFEDFYEDIFEELRKFGDIETLNVCDNLADHMIGNVYVQFREEDQAAAALKALQGRNCIDYYFSLCLNHLFTFYIFYLFQSFVYFYMECEIYCILNRYYSGRPIIADFSPVTDFREATCRQYEEDSCNRGGYCNFMHVKMIGRELRRKLFGRFYNPRHWRSRSRSRSRSPRGPPSRRERERERDSGRGSRDRDRDRRYDNGGGRRRSRSRSPKAAREGSEERRARIEQWNREREGQ